MDGTSSRHPPRTIAKLSWFPFMAHMDAVVKITGPRSRAMLHDNSGEIAMDVLGNLKN